MAVTAFTNYWRSFGFAEEDPEFIVNYHKYRMGPPRREKIRHQHGQCTMLHRQILDSSAACEITRAE
jgi:hypothetical protein